MEPWAKTSRSTSGTASWIWAISATESSRESVTRSAPASRHQRVPRASWMFAWVEICVSTVGMSGARGGEEPPVLDDEGVSAEDGAALDVGERAGKLGFLDNDVDGDVDARAGEVGLAAGGLKGVVGEVSRFAAGVEGAHAAIDGVGAGGEGGPERLRAPGGGEKLMGRTFVGQGG